MKEKYSMPPGATLSFMAGKQLQAAGWKNWTISRQTNLNHTTVRKLVASPDAGKRAGKHVTISMMMSLLIRFTS
jgi:hypothetical protein